MDTEDVEERVGNWNKINKGICFNFFRLKFYFSEPTI